MDHIFKKSQTESSQNQSFERVWGHSSFLRSEKKSTNNVESSSSNLHQGRFQIGRTYQKRMDSGRRLRSGLFSNQSQYESSLSQSYERVWGQRYHQNIKSTNRIYQNTGDSKRNSTSGVFTNQSESSQNQSRDNGHGRHSTFQNTVKSKSISASESSVQQSFEDAWDSVFK